MMTYSLRRGVNRIASATGLLLSGILVLTMGLAFVSIAARAQTPAAPSVIEVKAPTAGPIAPVAVTNYRCHILPVQPTAGQVPAKIIRPDCDNQGTGPAGPESTSCSTGGCGVLNYHGGPFIASTSHTFYFLNCISSCFSDPGNPLGFLNDFFASSFVHVLDQYIANKTSGRYLTTVNGEGYVWTQGGVAHTIQDSDVQAFIVNLIRFQFPNGGGGGYDAMYSFFLPQGQDLCFTGQPTQCYSPDVPANFVFCAYHGSFNSTDAKGAAMHVIYQAMPYQNVSGCQTTGGPNGTLTDSTNSVLSHEISETITDPDLNAWWRTSDGSEIGDICYLQRQNPIYLRAGAYDIQPEYSNAATDCVAAYKTLALSHDFNFDMNSDIVWRNSNGDLAMWQMNGSQLLKGPGLGNVPTSWTVVGQQQLDNSGHADLIWRNTNGDVAIWMMNGAQVLSAPDIGNVPTNWSIVGTGPYNATKGYAELFWRDTAGDLAIWQMNGTTLLAGPGLGNVPTNWTIVGTGDFYGDGNTDILWRNTAGDVSIWRMNGTTVSSTTVLGNIPTSWTIVGTGDFNGDGYSDILWRDTTGDVAIWYMNGTQITSSAWFGNGVAASWSVAETGDFNSDAYSDILWRNTNGDVVAWLMNPAQNLIQVPFIGNVPISWTIQGANSD
jgi:hypothetical protein